MTGSDNPVKAGHLAHRGPIKISTGEMWRRIGRLAEIMLAGAELGARLSGSATLAGRVVERQEELGTKNQTFDDSGRLYVGLGLSVHREYIVVNCGILIEA